MILRPRGDGDLDSCERVARLVQELDHYPAFASEGLRDFVEGRGFYEAWVAEVDGEVIGQVLLRPRSSRMVMEVVRHATGLPDDCVGVIARLFVSPRSAPSWRRAAPFLAPPQRQPFHEGSSRSWTSSPKMRPPWPFTSPWAGPGWARQYCSSPMGQY